jgi:Ni2+-binding GTPase involved in maturation of urease and hydrogenase
MSKPSIRIDVIGDTGSGKSAVIALIDRALRDAGLDTEVYAVDHDHSRTPDDNNRIISELRNKQTVFKLHEVYALRKS